MKVLEVEPGAAIGPVRLGMTRDEVIEAAATAGFSCHPLERWPDHPEVFIIANQVQAYFASDDHVEAIEAATYVRARTPSSNRSARSSSFPI